VLLPPARTKPESWEWTIAGIVRRSGISIWFSKNWISAAWAAFESRLFGNLTHFADEPNLLLS